MKTLQLWDASRKDQIPEEEDDLPKMVLLENTIIDYFGNNEMCLGNIVKITGQRLQVKGATSKIDRVASRLVLANYGKSKGDPLQELISVQEQIQEKLAEIDTDLLWQELLSIGEKAYNLSELSELYFAEDSSLTKSALARALINNNLHFQRQGQDFIPRSPEGVKELEKLRAERAERAALREKQKQWLHDTLFKKTEQEKFCEIPEEMKPLVQLVTDFLFKGFNSDIINLLSEIELKLSLREKALRLLKNCNALPEDADEFLLVNGIHAEFSEKVLQHLEKLPDFCSLSDEVSNRPDLSNQVIFSIDDDETEEIDDAISVEISADKTLVNLHFADPSCFVDKDDILDKAAVERPLSLYLPTTTVTMFPSALSSDFVSLNQGERRPALSFLLEFSKDAELLDWQIVNTQVKVTERLSYIKANEILSDESNDLHPALNELYRLAKILEAKRIEAGAASLNRPELKIRVDKGEIFISEDRQDTASHFLIQEFMIQANYLAAKYALRQEIPIIYRSQDPPSEKITMLDEYDPLHFDQSVRKMKKSRLSTYPEAHAGLGLDLYTQISSPIRRYADLVIQRQISAHLRQKEVPYTQEELFAVLDNVEKTTYHNRSLEKEAKKFWLLEYLNRNCLNKQLDATIVRIDGNLILAELQDYYERGVVITRERLKTGQKIKVEIIESNPKSGRLAMKLLVNSG